MKTGQAWVGFIVYSKHKLELLIATYTRIRINDPNPYQDLKKGASQWAPWSEWGHGLMASGRSRGSELGPELKTDKKLEPYPIFSVLSPMGKRWWVWIKTYHACQDGILSKFKRASCFLYAKHTMHVNMGLKSFLLFYAMLTSTSFKWWLCGMFWLEVMTFLLPKKKKKWSGFSCAQRPIFILPAKNQPCGINHKSNSNHWWNPLKSRSIIAIKKLADMEEDVLMRDVGELKNG